MAFSSWETDTLLLRFRAGGVFWLGRAGSRGGLTARISGGSGGLETYFGEEVL